MDNVPLTYWQRIQQRHLLCSLFHIAVGVIIALFAFDPLGRLDILARIIGAGVPFTWFTIYECFQWWTKKDCPSQELGEAMIGFLAAMVVCGIL